MKRVLVIDLEKRLRDFDKDAFGAEELEFLVVEDERTALRLVEQNVYQLVILGNAYSGVNIDAFCRELRKKAECPIVMCSFSTQPEDVMRGLNAGADDYLCMPISAEEVKARIAARIRQEDRARKLLVEKGELSCSGVTVNLDARRVFYKGQEIRLSGREFDLLVCLMQNAGRPMARIEIFEQVWKTEYGDIGAVAFNIKKLRAKLDPEGNLIRTIWGRGYQFAEVLDGAE